MVVAGLRGGDCRGRQNVESGGCDVEEEEEATIWIWEAVTMMSWSGEEEEKCGRVEEDLPPMFREMWTEKGKMEEGKLDS